jgi:hypothetical protein
MDDLHAVAPMALRQRRSTFIREFFAQQLEEEVEIARVVSSARRKSSLPRARRRE